jgi:hypothetical protein
MKFLTDVKSEKFVCIECRQTAFVGTLENIRMAWCDTFGCSNTSTIVNFDGKWIELEHEEIFEVEEIQDMLAREIVIKGMERRARDNSSKTHQPRAHLTLVNPRIKT